MLSNTQVLVFEVKIWIRHKFAFSHPTLLFRSYMIGCFQVKASVDWCDYPRVKINCCFSNDVRFALLNPIQTIVNDLRHHLALLNKYDKNIFMPKNINFITIITTLKAIYFSKNFKMSLKSWHLKLFINWLLRQGAKMYFSSLICLFFSTQNASQCSLKLL